MSSGVDPKRRVQVVIAITIAVALTVAGLVRANGGRDYAQEVAELCRSVDEKLRSSSGNYFESVAMTSQARAAGLAKLRPDAAHAAVHADLVAVEGQLTTAAQYAQNLYASAGVSAAAAQLTSVRATELEQNGRYQTLGIQGCAD
jgi:hypothetical protein